ncbi:hypothetical protein EOS_29015 [Caballeronia mineralivorans PML1(12)]|uniref:Uncharacterized protein n=1 Tax=Caballeronia mineralivorans PML1(12) TaxID=908627 RepID=A0A0J1CR15_9BURK|nr:hypothetical protein EOS_29015 [Caballeronia mineralivorans PML1(12)]
MKLFYVKAAVGEVWRTAKTFAGTGLSATIAYDARAALPPRGRRNAARPIRGEHASKSRSGTAVASSDPVSKREF